MTAKTIATARFTDASELGDAIQSLLLGIGDREIVYVASNGFMHTGMVVLLEETLTDGSVVFNMEIGEDK